MGVCTGRKKNGEREIYGRNVIQRANIKIREEDASEHGQQDDEEADEEEEFAFIAAEIVTATLTRPALCLRVGEL